MQTENWNYKSIAHKKGVWGNTRFSEIGSSNELYFSGEIYKCLWVVLGHFPDYLCPPLGVNQLLLIKGARMCCTHY